MNQQSKSLGWVLYDGACRFCSWWIPFWKKTINKTGYDIAPLQSKWVCQTLKQSPLKSCGDKVQGDNLREEQTNRDILLLLADGSVIAGADAYIYGMKKVRWSRPFGYLLGLPGFRWLTWQFYKLFNRNRLFVSKVCRLKPEMPDIDEYKKSSP